MRRVEYALIGLAVLLLAVSCRLKFEQGGDGDADGGLPGSEAEIGNWVTMTFDRDVEGVFFDRSKADRRDGYGFSVGLEGGSYGEGGYFNSSSDEVTIPDGPGLFLGNQLTIEAWIFPEVLNSQQVIFGDIDPGSTPNAEISFELGSTNRLTLVSNAGCEDESQIAVAEGTAIEQFRWSHVATTWDGSNARFYLNAELVAEVPFAHTPCESVDFRPFLVGNSIAGDRAFSGVIDELKVSDYPKSAADLAASMAFNTGVLLPRCGDQIIELDEQCDGDELCCDSATCQFVVDGTVCGTSGTCAAGRCQLAGGRVTDGLVALYEFNEAAGPTVTDTSGVAPALDLTINDELLVTWSATTLTIANNVIISSAAGAAKIRDAAVASNEITVEAWLQPENLSTTIGRPVTFSGGTSSRNILLLQNDDQWISRIRTTAEEEGHPQLVSAEGDASDTRPNHVVVTRSADGLRRLYVDGALRSISRVAGDFSSWDTSFQLHLGNETPLAHDWDGTYHLVAIYGRALDAVEVAQNFSAGADP